MPVRLNFTFEASLLYASVASDSNEYFSFTGNQKRNKNDFMALNAQNN